MLRTFLENLLGRSREPDAGVTRPSGDADDIWRAADAQYEQGHHAEVVRLHAEAPAGSAPAASVLRLGHSLQYLRRFADAARVYVQLDDALARAGAAAAPRALVKLHLGLSYLRGGEFGAAVAPLDAAHALSGTGHGAHRIVRYPAIMAEDLPLLRRPEPPLAPPLGEETRNAALDIVYNFVAADDDSGAYWRLFERTLPRARRSHPGARLVLVTNRATDVPRLGFDQLLRAELPRDDLMANRYRAALAYLDVCAPGSGMAVFTESDCVLQHDLRGALPRGADLYLTCRSNFVDEAEDVEPCNTGVMLLDLGRHDALRRFFGHCLDAFDYLESRPEIATLHERPLRRWRGDQLALGAVLGWRTYIAHVLSGETDCLSVDGCRVGFLPSDPYNFAWNPEVAADALARKYVLHYKGPRKHDLLASA